MTSLFFSLLPVDVQIDILITWINHSDCGCGLLRVLSALDSVCSKADRQAFLTLVNQLPSFGKHQPKSTDNSSWKYDPSFMQWLSTRKVPLRCLMLRNSEQSEAAQCATEPLPLLPSIEVVFWTDKHAADKYQLVSIMQSCPNVTKLHIDHVHGNQLSTP